MSNPARSAIVLIAAIAVLVVCAPREDVHANFPLEGQHAVLLCETCHGTDGFEALLTECAECHEDTRPNGHYAGDCGECHNDIGWDNFGETTGQSDHDFLPLVNAHNIGCDSCHIGEGYLGLDATCESCHERPNDYHFAGQDCVLCHAPTVWTDGKEHLFAVPHNDVDACTDCHSDPADLATAICTTCHPVAEMEPLHNAVYGFEANDPACIGCHPDGAK